MTNADFVCYTSEEEYEDLCNFFYKEYEINRNRLTIKMFNLADHYFFNVFKTYKNYEESKLSDRCTEIQYMKFIWCLQELQNYDYCYWIDAGLSHCGLIPSKYLATTGKHNSQYYDSTMFNNTMLDNLITFSEDKFVLIGKDNVRNYWSGTVNPELFNKYDSSIHIIGGMFGGKTNLWTFIVEKFKEYVYIVCDLDKRIYHEEDIMTLMFRNHEEKFKLLHFDTWWHEDERVPGLDIIEHTKNNKSFYKILEELNGIYE
jgi:hypothetical protein